MINVLAKKRIGVIMGGLSAEKDVVHDLRRRRNGSP